MADLVQEFLEDKGEDRNFLQIHVYQSNTLAILVRLSIKNVLWGKYEKSLHSSFFAIFYLGVQRHRGAGTGFQCK